MGITSVAIQFTIIDMLSRGVDAIKGRMKGLAAANADVQASFDKMAKMGKYAAIAGIGTRAIYKGLKPAISAAGDLQAELRGTEAELKGGAKNAADLAAKLEKVKGTAFAVQAWTPFDEGQIVALEKQLLKSGAKISQVIGKQGAAAASAALATYSDLDPVAMGKNLIGIGTPFKLQADQFMGLADQISRAASASTLGPEELAETAKYAAPAMAQLNRSIHEMLVLSALLAKRGLGGTMSGTGLRQFFNAAAKVKAFRDAAGNLKPLAAITEILEKRLSKLGEAEKLAILTKIFDVRGAPVAMALMAQGEQSYASVEAAMKESIPLQEKLNIAMEGFNKQWTALKGTSRSTVASLYQPALVPLTALLKGTNALMTMLGTASQKHNSLNRAVSGMSLGGLALGGAATIGLTGAALWYGKKVLKGVGGFKGLFSSAGNAAAGIVTGKAVEAATGVKPVFVTNWPAGFGGGVAGTAGAAAEGAIGASVLKKMGGATLLKGTVAGAVGYAIGTGFNMLAGHISGQLSGGKYGGSGWLGKMVYDWWHPAAGRIPAAPRAMPYTGPVNTMTSRPLSGYGDIPRDLPRMKEPAYDEAMLAQFFSTHFDADKNPKAPIVINMAIDEQRRVTAETGDMDVTVNPSVKRGRFGK